MAAGTFTLYNSFAELVADGTIDLDTDTFKCMLVSSAYTPSLAHDEKADVTNELATANGYTAGGATLGSVTWGQVGGVSTFDSADVSWTPSGGAITARYAVLYDDTATNDKLVGYMLLDAAPADVSRSSPDLFTITPHASQGWFQLTVNP